MKTRYIVSRYLSVIGRLSNGRKATFDQLNNYIINQGIEEGEEGISQRTFQRMVKDIEFVFNVTIKCDSDGFYSIVEDYSNDQVTRLSQSFHLMNYQKHFENYSKHISYDAMCTKGQEYLYDIQKAMKEKSLIILHYQKFSSDNTTTEKRTIAPYGLKESHGRWYVVGKDVDINQIRVFGLDRIQSLDETERRFVLPENFSVQDYFKDSVGVYTDEDSVAELIRLQFSKKLAGYIENFPIHASQVTEEKTDDHIVVKLRAFVNTDLINTLMTYSDDVKVLRPTSLKNQIIDRGQAILKNNQ